MGTGQVWLTALAVALVVLAGALTALEAALVRVSRVRAAELSRRRRRGAERLVEVVADPAPYLNVLLLLRIACEVVAVLAIADLCIGWIGETWPAYAAAAAIMLVVSYVAVGVGPRTLGIRHADRIALAGVSVFGPVARLLGPAPRLLIAVGNALTPGRGFPEGPFASEAELRELVDLAEQRDVIAPDERAMIHSVFELGDTLVREVMVPRTDIVFAERGRTLGELRSLALRSGFSRIPVLGENEDDVVGVAYLKDVVRRLQDDPDAVGAAVSAVLREPTFVPDSKPVDDLLREMQARRIHVAMVIDEYGGTAGLVTIEDILEELVGEIVDEYDVETPPVERLPDGAVRVTARLPVEDLAELFDVPIPDEGVDTVGGLLAHALGRVPIEGATAVVAGVELRAEGAAGRRNTIGTVLARRVPSDDAPPVEHSE